MAAIELRPITLLVGRNSSGKSSYLRTLPLLRQSLMTRTSSPILWYGDLIDFGSYDNVVYNNDPEVPITFRFGLDTIDARTSEYFFEEIYLPGRVRSLNNVEINVSIQYISGTTYLSHIHMFIKQYDSIFSADINKNGNIIGLKLNNNSILDYLSDFDLRAQLGTIFPEIFAHRKSKDDNARRFPRRTQNFLTSAVVKTIKPFLDQRIKSTRLNYIANQILSLNAFDANNLLDLAQTTDTRSFKKFLIEICHNDTWNLRSELKTLFLANLFFPALRSAFSQLRLQLSQILYIGPARARSERYYRYQELAVSEIDPDGKNFPMFLNSLNTKQLSSFSEWVKRRFGYGVEIERPRGHISINLLEEGAERNIVDTGYGVSQILPVLGQIWWAKNAPPQPRDSRSRGPQSESSLLLIEQPELHLHPAHQALLADAFVGEGRRPDDNADRRTISFLVETHSEALVNRLGHLVAENQISAKDIQIAIFEPDQANDSTVVKIAEFDDHGVLVNWPYGFFQAD